MAGLKGGGFALTIGCKSLLKLPQPQLLHLPLHEILQPARGSDDAVSYGLPQFCIGCSRFLRDREVLS